MTVAINPVSAAPPEHPLLFSGPMVRAILAGRKSQTRRILNPQPDRRWNLVSVEAGHATFCEGDHERANACSPHRGYRCRQGRPGHRLWVRETWQLPWNGSSPMFRPSPEAAALYDQVAKTATPRVVFAADATGLIAREWRPSIFMPRWACRLVLEVTDIRVQRLQAISEEDAEAEGVGVDDEGDGPPRYYPCVACSGDPAGIASLCHPIGRGRPWRCVFANLWDAINGKRSPWASNAWVWCVSFAVVKP